MGLITFIDKQDDGTLALHQQLSYEQTKSLEKRILVEERKLFPKAINKVLK